MSSNAFFTSADSVNVSKAYSGSFGNLPTETVYQDLMGALGSAGHDVRPEIAKAWEPEYRAIDEMMADGASFREATEEVAKTLTTSDLTLPVYPQSELANVAVKRTPVAEMLPKISRQSNTVEQDSITALGQAEIGGETDVPSGDADDSFSPQSLSMTYYRIRGSVSGPMQLASSTLRNSMAGEQQRKAMSMNQFQENLVLNGDPTAATTDGSVSDERGYKGIRTLAIDNGETTANPAGGLGTKITAQDVRNNLKKATDDGGNADTIVHVTGNKGVHDLKSDLDDHDPVMVDSPTGTVSLGARSVMVDGTPVVVSDFMPDTELLTFDLRWHRIHNLADLTMESLAKVRDSDDFFMKRYQVLEQAAGASKYTHLLQGAEA